jgi:tight adherence protein C
MGTLTPMPPADMPALTGHMPGGGAALLLLVALFALATGISLVAVVTVTERRTLMQRAKGGGPAATDAEAMRGGLRRLVPPRLLRWIVDRAPATVRTEAPVIDRLVRAGIEQPAAPVLYALARIASAVLVPAAVAALVPATDTLVYTACVLLAAVIGALAPVALLDAAIGRRQQALRHGVPDALDLLVVCVEAGVALDAAMQRVGREMQLAHPTLATELMAMSRRSAAGMPRDQAMMSLYQRTGLEELRTLMSHLVQSERWGTSVATVLRVYARDLRRRRKQAAEKRAATASTRMLLPLALFIFPTIFIVILGPAMLQIVAGFHAMP